MKPEENKEENTEHPDPCADWADQLDLDEEPWEIQWN